MFEDSTFESTGRIRTRSRGWMLATFAFNGSVVLALILIPLIYPEALPRMAAAFLMSAPPAPAPQPLPQEVMRTAPAVSEERDDVLLPPRIIPAKIYMASAPEPPFVKNAADWDPNSSGADGAAGLFRGQGKVPVVVAQAAKSMKVSSGVMEGMIVWKALPVYPPIARATRTQGTVVLQATISKNGTIENLRVVSGPDLLRQAALDAVATWRYRPYLLNGQPVDVETTVNVDFTLQ